MSARAATARLRRLLPLAPAAATLYVAVAGIATAATIAAVAVGRPSTKDWIAFVVLAAAAASAQLFIVRTGNNQGFHTAIVFVTAGVLLLPPELVALMAITQHVPEWIKERYPAYIQTFNISNYALDGLAAWAVVHALHATSPHGGGLGWTAGCLAGAVSLVLVNHFVLASMLRLARGHSFRESELFSVKGLGIDVVLGLLGIAFAFAWRENPWLIPTLAAPLVAAHRGFGILGALRESEQRFRAMFEAAPFGVALADLDGRLLESNVALERMLGYSGDELAALPADSLSSSEGQMTARDGREVVVHVAEALVPDADGRPKYRLSLIEDVTRRAELEEQLRQAQRLEAVGRLAGGVAHDFNNLLTAISGYADIALGRLEPSAARLRSDLEEIRKASERATTLTAQLLAFGRKQILQPRDVDLNDLVADMHSLLRRLIGEHVELSTVYYGPELPRVHADPGRLEQVVVNLVVNARDAMPRGGRITIETSCIDLPADAPLLADGAEPGPYAVLCVRDNGVGMAAEDVAQVFEPFFTTKEVGQGTGLGLATVHGIVAQSGGFVTVDSEPGLGTTFGVYLPLLVNEAEMVAEPEAEPQPAHEAPAGRETILLVEDEAVVRGLVREMLESSGYDVVEAEDGIAALARAAETGPIDLLMTDVVMPGMTGRELVERLRERHGPTRVLYTSGYTDAAIVSDGVLDEGTHFLQKPFGISALIEKVRAVLDAAETLHLETSS